MADNSPFLPPRLVDYLRPGAPALMLTLGADGYANSAYTWLVAMDATRLRFAVDLGSSTLDNLRRGGQAAIQVIGPGDIGFLVKGTARQIKARVEAAAPAMVTLWEMNVIRASDQSWPGVHTTALAFEWAVERRAAMLSMERAVYAEMRDCAP